MRENVCERRVTRVGWSDIGGYSQSEMRTGPKGDERRDGRDERDKVGVTERDCHAVSLDK